MSNSVELWVLKSKCEGVKMLFLFRKLSILDSRIFSNSLEKTAIRDMGLRSYSYLGDEILGIGITWAVLKAFGKILC